MWEQNQTVHVTKQNKPQLLEFTHLHVHITNTAWIHQ